MRRTIEAVWRIESPRLVAGLARIVRDVGIAEELAQDALVAALEQWPDAGVPDKPGAWLMATAKHRAIDQLRRRQRFDEKRAELGRDLERRETDSTTMDDVLDDDIGDDLLRLMFVACHPIVSADSRVALTLRLLGGLTTEEIARGFLVPVATIAARITRAKHSLADARVPFEVPDRSERAARLASVLEVIYLTFNEGYAATAGGDWMRPALCDDALRLGRMLVAIAPEEAEAYGLLALMELQASRMRARLGPGGEPILLADQDRTRWNQPLIRRGLSALARSEVLSPSLGPYAVQAAIAACHVLAASDAETDWIRIAALYTRLAQLLPTSVVDLNRAVAVGKAFGAEHGLAIVDGLTSERSLETYYLLPAVRGDLLSKLGRHAEARSEFARAASLTRNARERTLLLERAADAARRGA